jgi:large subunit ribosomal protein L18
MKSIHQKKELRQKRIWRIRKKVVGTAERPRLCISFSNKHIYAQAIDDRAGRTLLAVSSNAKDLRAESLRANRSSATRLGTVFAEKAKESGIEAVVFDRHGRPYHGRVKEFAEAARAGGLNF